MTDIHKQIEKATNDLNITISEITELYQYDMKEALRDYEEKIRQIAQIEIVKYQIQTGQISDKPSVSLDEQLAIKLQEEERLIHQRELSAYLNTLPLLKMKTEMSDLKKKQDTLNLARIEHEKILEKKHIEEKQKREQEYDGINIYY